METLLLVLIVLLSISFKVHGRIVGAAILPHGDFALDPSLVNYRNGSLHVHKACLEVADWIQSLKPERLVLSTPHGLELSHDWAVYLNSHGHGVARIGEDLHDPKIQPYEVTADATLDPVLSTALLQDAQAKGAAITGLKGLADGEPIQLGWAEVVPLTLLRGLGNGTQLVVVSHPLRRYDHAAEMVPELLALGASMAHTLHGTQERVVVLVSADLAHTHAASGPYGYSPASQPFDHACARWASTMEPAYLLREAAALSKEAKACGYTGLVLLEGMLHPERYDNKSWGSHAGAGGGGRYQSESKAGGGEEASGGGGQWVGRVLANEHPTYYGMMAALFERKQ